MSYLFYQHKLYTLSTYHHWIYHLPITTYLNPIYFLVPDPISLPPQTLPWGPWECTSDNSGHNDHDWLWAPATAFWKLSLCCTEILLLLAASRPWLSVAERLRPIPERCQTPLTGDFGNPKLSCQTFLRAPLGCKMLPSDFPSFLHFFTWGQTCVIVQWLPQPPYLPPHFFS